MKCNSLIGSLVAGAILSVAIQGLSLAQTAPVQGTGSAGTPAGGILTVQGAPSATPIPSTSDPCGSAAKSSVAISVGTAATTQLVAISGSLAIYVCGFAMTIAPSGTSADTALFEYGTSSNCTGTNALTGTFGNGDLTSATGVLAVSHGGASQTIMKAPSANGLCIVTAGTAVNVQGVLSYVQQ